MQLFTRFTKLILGEKSKVNSSPKFISIFALLADTYGLTNSLGGPIQSARRIQELEWLKLYRAMDLAG